MQLLCKQSKPNQFHFSYSLLYKLFSLAKLRSLLRQWQHNLSSRRQLSMLDQQMLKDIGMSRSEALKESSKPFWK